MVGKNKNTPITFFLVTLLYFYPLATSAQIIIAPPEEQDAVIVVPGIVGSFNLLSLFADINKGLWGIVPMFDIYSGLTLRLQAEGYVKDEDLFVAYYDWRQPNAESVEEFLAPMIAQAKQKTGRVDIIAHSMGGLLIQQYIQSDQYTPGEIDQFVMLGTPNEGASAAYLPWEGGIFPSTWSQPIRFYMNAIERSLRSKRSIADTPPKSYRQIFPSIKELLPVNNYLTKGDTQSTSSERNTFLETLQDARDNLLNSDITVTTIAGTENTTLGTVALSSERTNEDIALERWRDGHPIQEVPTPNTPEGDRTVLTSSALFGPNQVTVGNVPHNALPEYAQEEVLAVLGIESDQPEIFTYTEPKWLTGFVVLSPVDITITDSNGNVASQDKNDFGDNAYINVDSDVEDAPKLVILKDLPGGIYTITLTGTDTGSYTVITTHTNEDATTTKTLTGTTTLGKEETFTVTINDKSAVISELASNSTSSISAATGGPSDDTDCCPGRDTKINASKKGKVLGVATKKKLKLRKVPIGKLQPLNGIFFEVFGRMPTYQEWKYWAERYLTDKGDWSTLRGTMQWWHLQKKSPIV